jgi:hypothetical protein
MARIAAAAKVLKVTGSNMNFPSQARPRGECVRSACKASEIRYSARLRRMAGPPPRPCTCTGLGLGPPSKPIKEFKEQVPEWLSLKEKYRHIAGATAARMTR